MILSVALSQLLSISWQSRGLGSLIYGLLLRLNIQYKKEHFFGQAKIINGTRFYLVQT